MAPLRTTFSAIKIFRLDCYKTSFLPSSIELWNNLSVDCRSVTSLNLFKKSISNITRATAPKFYYIGERKFTILHSRLRNSCSSLNGDLHRVNIVNDPSCSCGYYFENAFHYFFDCSKYTYQRNILFASLNQINIHPVTLELLLYGDCLLSDTINSRIFSYVQLYIKQSSRF